MIFVYMTIRYLETHGLKLFNSPKANFYTCEYVNNTDEILINNIQESLKFFSLLFSDNSVV
jgi:hypothetical protein